MRASVLRHRQALAAGLLSRQGRPAFDARGDRGGRVARRRRNERPGARPRHHRRRSSPIFSSGAGRRNISASRSRWPSTCCRAPGLPRRTARADALVAAALLHDIGHFTSEFGTYSPDDTRTSITTKRAPRCWRRSFRRSSPNASGCMSRRSAISAPPTRAISENCRRPRCIRCRCRAGR